MVWRAKVLVAAIVAVFAGVGSSACSSAFAQTEEEAAAGFTADNPNRLADLYLPDGGTQPCQQINITRNDCHDPNGFQVACCFYVATPSPTQLQGPGCWEFGPSIEEMQQVGKGFCCTRFSPGYGPTDWVRFEDFSKACDFCGGKTPGPNECCTRDRDVIPAYPVTDPSVCPDLMQDPDHKPSITDPPCGSKEMEEKGIHIPQEIGPVIFSVACGFHDECYSACNKDRDVNYKAQCDTKLGEDLSSDCSAYWQPAIDNARTPDDRVLAKGGLSDCLTAARVYFLAVSDKLPVISNSKGGQSAYDKAQREVCRCCKGGPDGEVLP